MQHCILPVVSAPVNKNNMTNNKDEREENNQLGF